MKASTKRTTIDRAGIEDMVNHFYQSVRERRELNAIFESQIGITQEDWAPHLERMYSFWSSILIREASYVGNPMVTHQSLPFFDLALFETWLAVFKETVFSLFEEDIAQEIFDRATKIAKSLRAGVETKRKTNQ